MAKEHLHSGSKGLRMSKKPETMDLGSDEYRDITPKETKMADKANWISSRNALIVVLVGLAVWGGASLYSRLFSGPSKTTMAPLVTTAPLPTEEAKAPTLSPKEKEDAEWKVKVEKTLAKLVDREMEREEAKKAPSATDPQRPTEAQIPQGDPRMQQPQGGYGGQQASPPVDPNVARFNQMAPTRHTRRGDVNFQLNNLKIPEAGLNDCERRGGQIVPGPGHYDRRGHYVGKNICSVGGGNSGH